jgi:hypothetical protein
MKFRKKPVVIGAEQYKGQEVEGVCTDPGCESMRRYKSADARDRGGFIMPHIHTLAGAMIVSPDDWIITSVKGERYPIKDAIFRETYEPVEE